MGENPFLPNFSLSGKPRKDCTLFGFCDFSTKPKIYINRPRAKSTTVVHEFLHFVTHQNFHSLSSSELNEGVTEYFTRKIQAKFDASEEMTDFKDDRLSYPHEYSQVGGVRNIVKNFYRQMADQARNQPIQIGRHRKNDFMPDPTKGGDTIDLVKKPIWAAIH